MIHGTASAIGYAVTGIFHAPAKVHLLHVGIQVGIEAAHVVVYLSPHKHTASPCPENLYRIVVLPVVLLQCEKDPSAAKKITPFVNKATARTGIFKHFFIPVIFYFWLTGGDV